jgi:Domain of unknown function (DUF4252)
MNTLTANIPTRRVLLLLPLLALLARIASAAPLAPLKLPDFDLLTSKATQSVNITLDSNLLGLAASFLDSGKPEDAAAKELIAGLQGVYVRSFSFDEDFAYSMADVDAVRKQLTAPGWQRLVGVRSGKEKANVDIFISVDAGRANGLAIISSEPRQLTIVNIVGSIDLQKLHKLEGKFGIPKLQLEEGK